MRAIVLMILSLISILSHAQSLEYGDVRLGKDNELKKKTHISQVLSFEEASAHELYSLCRNWFWAYFWENKRVYKYGTDWTSGGGWDQFVIERFKPYSVDIEDKKIGAELIMCEECCQIRGKADDMVYVFEMQFREGRVKIIATDFYDLDQRIFVNTLTTKGGRMILKSDDKIVTSLEEEFKKNIQSLNDFLAEALKDKTEKSNPQDSNTDDW